MSNVTALSNSSFRSNWTGNWLVISFSFTRNDIVCTSTQFDASIESLTHSVLCPYSYNISPFQLILSLESEYQCLPTEISCRAGDGFRIFLECSISSTAQKVPFKISFPFIKHQSRLTYLRGEVLQGLHSWQPYLPEKWNCVPCSMLWN